jgi:TP901 family phage tail tape measure protein
MSAVFTLFGELKADTGDFTKNLLNAERVLENAETALTKTEQKAKELGATTATTGRGFEKMNEKLQDTHRKLAEAVSDFNKGDINAKQFGKAIDQAEKSFGSLNSRVKDSSARLDDFGNRSKKSLTMSVAAADLLSNAFSAVAGHIKDFAVDGVKMNASLDKLVRFTATLDKSFQTPVGLRTLNEDFRKLATQIPQSAEDIAKASFTVKSAFSDLSETDLIDYLKQIGLAATASNTDIATHADHIAALAKQYGITAKELPKFNALIASSFGQALASDNQVAAGFNEIVNTAKSTKQPLEALIASMSTLQGASNDAAGNTTLLKNALEKLSDPKYIEGFDGIGISVFNAKGEFKDIGQVINEVAEKMKGLSDEDITKKFDFLKDAQARQGFLTLARNVQAYNDQLKNGADAKAFTDKTNTMLDATENRWAKFWATITNTQSGLGGTISDKLLSAFDSTTFLGGLDIFVNKSAAAVQSGMIKIFAAGRIQGEQLKGASEQDIAKLTDYYAGITNAIDENANKYQTDVLVKQREFWQSIAENTASPKVKSDALANIDSLNKSINSQLNAGALDQYDAWKKIADQAALGLQSGDAAAVQAAKDSIQKVSSALVQAMADPRLSDGAKADFRKLYESLPQIAGAAITDGKPQVDAAVQNLIKPPTKQVTDAGNILGTDLTKGVTDGILGTKPRVTSSINSLIQTNPAQVQRAGSLLGAALGEGIIGGIRSRQAAVASAVLTMTGGIAAAAKNSLEIKSPSKVFHRIGENVVEGFADGIKSKAPKIAESLNTNITKQVTEFKKQLDASLKENAATTSGFGKTFEIRAKIFDADKVKSQLDELIKLRLELGVNVDKPLVAADLSREIYQLDKVKDSAGKLVNFIEDGGDLGSKEVSEFMRILSDPAATKLIKERADAIGLTVDAMRAEVVIAAQAANLANAGKSINDLLKSTAGGGRPTDNAPTSANGDGIENDPVSIIGDVPKVKKAWEDFFKTFNIGIKQIKDSLPEIKVAIGENLLNSVAGIGDVFANAVTNWDGTAKGFFRSIASGFAQMAKEIIAQLIRIAVMQTVLKLIGLAAGNLGGVPSASDLPSSGVGIGGSVAPPGGHFASGGFTGNGAIDKVAGVVHGKEFVMPFQAVKKYGLGMMEGMRNLSAPPMAAAGGGTYNNQRSMVFNINATGGTREQNQQSAMMIRREITMQMQRDAVRNK